MHNNFDIDVGEVVILEIPTEVPDDEEGYSTHEEIYFLIGICISELLDGNLYELRAVGRHEHYSDAFPREFMKKI